MMTRINVYYAGDFGSTGLDGIDGANVVSSVDRANSDGTGVACLDCEDGDAVAAVLDEMGSVVSYSIH